MCGLKKLQIFRQIHFCTCSPMWLWCLFGFQMFLGNNCLIEVILCHIQVFQLFSYRDPSNGERIMATWGIILKYLFYQYTMYVFIVLLCVVMGLALTGFFFYHLSMITKDTTTNEKMKRSDFLQFFNDEMENLEKALIDPQ